MNQLRNGPMRDVKARVIQPPNLEIEHLHRVQLFLAVSRIQEGTTHPPSVGVDVLVLPKHPVGFQIPKIKKDSGARRFDSEERQDRSNEDFCLPVCGLPCVESPAVLGVRFHRASIASENGMDDVDCLRFDLLDADADEILRTHRISVVPSTVRRLPDREVSVAVHDSSDVAQSHVVHSASSTAMAHCVINVSGGGE